MPQPKFLTFDCYGTLVNFQLSKATLAMLGPRANQIENMDQFLNDFSNLRFEEVLGKYKSYRDVLSNSLKLAMTRYGLEYRDEDGEAIVAAVPTFGPFPDVPPVLDRLRQHFKLVILSNTDDDMIAHNVRRIGVPFDYVITAQQARAYKPQHAAFEYMRRVLGCEVHEILHVAQGFEYDIIPTTQLGWSKVWINRYKNLGNPAFEPYAELPDLSGLPALLEI